MKLIRTKPNFTLNELLVWVFFAGLSFALVPTLFGLAVGMASAFIVVIAGERAINAYQLRPWAKRLLRRQEKEVQNEH